MTQNPTCTLTRSYYWEGDNPLPDDIRLRFGVWAINAKALDTWEREVRDRWGRNNYYLSAEFDVEDYIRRLRDGGEDAESIAFYLRSERPCPPERPPGQDPRLPHTVIVSYREPNYHIWKAWRERAVRDFYQLHIDAMPADIEIDGSDPHRLYRYPDDIAPAFTAFISEVEKKSEWLPSDRCAQKKSFGGSEYRELLDKARDAITAVIAARTKDAAHATA